MRIRRPALLVAIGAVVALVAASPSWSAPHARLTPLRSFVFPDRAFVLTTPKPVALDSKSVHVRENGRAVHGVSVVQATTASGGTFGVVLVVDASYSMHGTPIVDALAAAREFAAHASPSEALGLVIFNDGVRVVAQPTTDSKAIAKALRTQPRLSVGTRLYDAAGKAIDLLQAAKIKAGSVVLVTDGRDVGSRLTLGALAAKARADGVRLFGVGLRSAQYTPGPLAGLARSTGAAYSEAGSPGGLVGIYRSLSERLASEYLVRYRSLEPPDAFVRVKVTMPGFSGAATSTYDSPPPKPAPPFRRSFFQRFVLSPGSVVVMSLLVALLVGIAVRALVKPKHASLRERIGEFVSVDSPGAGAGADQRVGPISAALRTLERRLEGKTWWSQFKEELEIGEFPIAPMPLLVGTALVTVILAFALGSLSTVAGFGCLAVPLVVRAAYKRQLRQKREKFEAQLPENLTVLSASLRAGHSFAGSLSAVLDEAEEPSRSELRRAVQDEQLGVPVEDALMRVAQRMGSGDLEQVALVASLQRDAGGNTPEVLDTVVNGIRERFEVRLMAKTLTAQGRMTRWILTLLPAGMALFIAATNPHYLSPLFTTTGGQVMLAVAVGLIVVGSLLIRQIMSIEV